MTSVDNSADLRAALLREAQAWLLHLTSGQATVKDAEAFRHWCALSPEHASAFAETRLMWDNLGPAIRGGGARIGADRPTEARARPAHRSGRMSRRAFLGGAVAASAAYVVARSPLGMWPSLTEWRADFHTATGEQRQIEAAPGVTVELNTQTAVNLRSLGDGFMSMELLTGEAQIMADARLAKPFTVFAEGGRVLAMAGTLCNVRCTGPKVNVICVRGQTRLDLRDSRALVHPDQQVEYDAKGIGAIAEVDPEVALAWRRRVLIFDRQPLSEVVAEINRYRPGKIIITNDALAARTVQARFSIGQLADVAALIHDAYDAQVTNLPGGIVLLS